MKTALFIFSIKLLHLCKSMSKWGIELICGEFTLFHADGYSLFGRIIKIIMIHNKKIYIFRLKSRNISYFYNKAIFQHQMFFN